MQVAVHAIIGNLHQYPAETRGYERACTSPDSPLPAALKAFEAVDFDSARALQLELVVHFMRCYSGMSLSPYIIRTVDDWCARAPALLGINRPFRCPTALRERFTRRL